MAGGVRHATEDEAEVIWADHLIWPEQYDESLDEKRDIGERLRWQAS